KQCRRARAERHSSWPEILAVLWIRSRRTTGRGHVQPDRHRQNERRRSAGLAHGYPHPHRRPSSSAAGRTAALELDATGYSALRSSGMTTHVNKVHHVTTITQVAKDLGEDEDWLRDVANEMWIEDGAIWVYGMG